MRKASHFGIILKTVRLQKFHHVLRIFAEHFAKDRARIHRRQLVLIAQNKKSELRRILRERFQERCEQRNINHARFVDYKNRIIGKRIVLIKRKGVLARIVFEQTVHGKAFSVFELFDD